MREPSSTESTDPDVSFGQPAQGVLGGKEFAPLAVRIGEGSFHRMKAVKQDRAFRHCKSRLPCRWNMHWCAQVAAEGPGLLHLGGLVPQPAMY